MLRFALLAALAVILPLEMQADTQTVYTFAYVYTFNLPAFDSNGNPDGGTFTSVIESDPGPIRNTAEQCDVGPICQGYTLTALTAPTPGMFSANADGRSSYTLLGDTYYTESAGATLELDFPGVSFGFAANDEFWSGAGGMFAAGGSGELGGGGIVETPYGFAVYKTNGADPPCLNCSVTITATPEPRSIALMAASIAALVLIAHRRLRSNPEAGTTPSRPFRGA
jgi:hypothetical protein